jgi:glycerophosphoryl diester phosphodiesterase
LMQEFDLIDLAIEKWKVLIQSFSTESLTKMHGMNNRLPFIKLVENTLTSADIRAQLAEIRTYAVGIGPSRVSVDAALIEAVHDAGLVIHPYTINEPEDIKRMIALGVDGVFTDYPDRLHALLGE